MVLGDVLPRRETGVDLIIVLLVGFMVVCVTAALWERWKLGGARLTRREPAEVDMAIDSAEERRQTAPNERPAVSHRLSPRPGAEDMPAGVAHAARAVRARPALGETRVETAVRPEIDVWRLDERD